jgi:hypothetical protein
MALTLQADTDPGTATWVESTAALGIRNYGQATVAANPQTLALAGVLVGDFVFVTLQSDDTGATKNGAVTAASVTAPGTVSVTFETTGTNGDGVMNVMVLKQ